MNKWEYFLSNDIIDIRDGTHDSPKYVENGFPLITSKNLVDGKICFDKLNYINLEDYNNINKRSKVDKGDILYSMIGSVGNYAIVEQEPSFAIKNVALFKFVDDRLYNGYFLYLLRSTVINRQIESALRGGTQKFVSLKILRNLKIPLPPISEQKRIATILDEADRLRQKDKQVIEKYNLLSQSVFLEMFGDPISNPKGWEYKKLEEVCLKITDGTHQSPNFIDDGVPFLFVSNIVDNEINFKTYRYISIEDYNILTKNTKIEKGDLLLTTVGSYGNPAVVKTSNKFCFQRHIAHLKPYHDKVNVTYLKHVLISPLGKRQIDRYAKGIAQKTLNLKDLKNITIFQPSLSLQNEFATIISEIEQQKSQAEKSLAKSEDLFNSLLQRAFKGEL